MTAAKSIPFYRSLLRHELESRVSANRRYSLRSFAQALQISSSALAQIMSGKRGISVKIVDRLITRLELSDVERTRFIDSVLEEKKAKGIRKINRSLTRGKTPSLTNQGMAGRVLNARELSSDEFKVISEWYHYAIREMASQRDFKADARWIGKKLGLSAAETKVALERLVELDLLRFEGKRWIKPQKVIDTKDKSKTSVFHRRRQKQILEKAIESLERDPIAIRNHSSITLCLDRSRLPEAKKLIENFMWELNTFLTNGKKDQVYEMAFQLFPLEKKGENL